jgi:predicted Rossmann-fold nucleotide-binding protein
VRVSNIGFNITLPHEQAPNAWSTPDLTFRFHYFAMRKMHLAMRASGAGRLPRRLRHASTSSSRS